MNRHHAKNSVISDSEIEKAIRRKIFWKVPNSYQKVIRTINSGDPTADISDSDVARSLMSWAESLGAKAGPSVDIKKKSGKSFLGLFGR